MICQVDPLGDRRWLDFVRAAPTSSVFHTSGWLQALKRTYGYEPAVLTTCDATSRLTNGLLFCRIESWATGRRLVSLPFSDHCEPLADDPETVRHLISGLEEKSREENARYLELRPVSPLGGVRPFTTPSLNYYLHRLDLRPGLQAISARFHRDCVQRKIRRAEREHLTVAEGRTADILKQFYALVVRTRRRQGLPPQPMAWFNNLIECLGPALTIRVASKESQPIAAILTIQHKLCLTYKYGASDERFHNLGGMVYLFWRAIQDAVHQGLELLDMGRSDIDNPGLIAFKEHWGAARSTLDYWRFPVASRKSAHNFAPSLMKTACSHIPDRCLTALGTLLYRHVG